MEWPWSVTRAVPDLDENLVTMVQELLKEVCSTDDNAEGVLDILDRSGFHDLAEDTKLYVLHYHKFDNNNGFQRVWPKIMRQDKIKTMLALLPLTPLFAVSVDSIPERFSWIETHIWMQTILHDNKLRWKLGKCGCVNHMNPTNHEEKLCALTELAFTIFAADLCTYGEMHARCFTFLLHAAPNLVTIKVPCDGALYQKFDYFSMSALQRSSHGICEEYLELGAFSWDVVNVLKHVSYYALDLHHPRTNFNGSSVQFQFFTEIISHGHEEELRNYRDKHGYSLLHGLCNNYNNYTEDATFIYCLKQLLHLGLDPTIKTLTNETALDILISNFCRHSLHWNLNLDFFRTLRKEDLEQDVLIYRAFVECFNMLLPWFQGTPLPEIKLPKFRSDFGSIEEIYMDYLTLLRILTSKDLFPAVAEENFAYYISDGMLYAEKTYPCFLCKPLVEITYREMCQGMDLNKSVWTDEYRYNYWCFECKYTLPQVVIRSHVNFYKWSHYKEEHLKASDQPAKCDCCLWSLLELLVHCTRAPLNFDTCNDCNVDASLMGLLSLLKKMRNIGRVVMLIWRYHPSSKGPLMDYLHQLGDDMTNDHDKGDDVIELKQLVKSVRPLILMCRLCILQHVQWRDVVHLPLPRQMKHYIQLGDIASDHVIHKVLS